MSHPEITNELAALTKVIKTVKELRHPQNGCPWDKEQTLASLTRFMSEEVAEYIDAVAGQNPMNIKEELGDVLFQILLNSIVAEQMKLFTLEEVALILDEKLIKRHPHVFAKSKTESLLNSEKVRIEWEKIKEESSSPNKLPFKNLPKNLSPLITAYKIGEKANLMKFDWENTSQVFDKVQEEVNELHFEISQGEKNLDNIEEEIGDLLFTAVQLARHEKISPELALVKANKKFIQRMHQMLEYNQLTTKKFTGLPQDQKEKLWKMAKEQIKMQKN